MRIHSERSTFPQTCTVFYTCPVSGTGNLTMHRRTLRRTQERVSQRKYVLILHDEEEMDDDSLTILDIESGILNSVISVIAERERDLDTGEWKSLIRGRTVVGADVGVIAKIGPADSLAIITVYSA